MFATDDTIVAIATPPGRGGIGIVRVSGPAAQAIAARMITHAGSLEPRRATFTEVRLTPDASATTIDQAVVTSFPAPHSYTGDDVVEISAHGSPVILRAIVSAAMRAGARLAEPGEFTLRAFLKGRIDLMQAEAVADLIDAVTPLQARAAFDQLQGTLTRAIGEIDAALFDLIARLEASVDFPDEGYHFVETGELARDLDVLLARTTAVLADARRGRLVREGLQIAIVGKPNVGKSSLFNALAGAARAIVNAAPGTTRDLVTETIDVCGLSVTLVDTAGLRATADEVEAEGVARARRAHAVADLTVLVLDRSRPLDADDREAMAALASTRRLIVANKIDLPAAWRERDVAPDIIGVSAVGGGGLDAMRHAIAGGLSGTDDAFADRPAITNIRHIALVQIAHDALGRARAAALSAGQSLSEEFVLADLQQARAALEEVAGRRASEDLLARIFERFCIGK